MEKFDILEEKISRLVDAYSALREEKTALGERLAEKELEIQKLKEKISLLSREREVAREKVEGPVEPGGPPHLAPGRDRKGMKNLVRVEILGREYTVKKRRRRGTG